MLTLDQIIQDFTEVGDENERFEMLLELGQDLPDFPDSEKLEAYLVQGCQSQVWLIPEPQLDSQGKLYFRADSDSLIVRGIIALLLACYSGKTPAEILAFDVRPLLVKIGLARHLSPSRSNGLFSMVKRMQQIAATFQIPTS